MYNKAIQKVAVFCLTSAAVGVSVAMTASSASAGPIYTWDLLGDFEFYFSNPNVIDPEPSYKLKIDVAGYTADNAANLFNNGNPLATAITYFEVYGTNGLTSHTDVSFTPTTDSFLAEWEPGQGNTLGLLNISSMQIDIKRKGSNLFDLTLFSTDANNIPVLIATDTNVSFKPVGSVPEPSTVFGLIGLAAFSLKTLKKTQNH